MTAPVRAPPIIAAHDAASFGVKAAEHLSGLLAIKPAATLVLPAGKTPLPLYHALRERHRAGDFRAGFTYCALDEYCGLPPGDARLLTGWMAGELLDPLAVPPERRLCFRSDAPDLDAEAARMEARLEARGGIDIAVLGLGLNGHIGFNEPGSDFDSRTRMVELTPATLAGNAAYWQGKPPPARAVTLGLGTLRRARHTLLLVTGASKVGILRRAFSAPPSPAIPASYLQTQDNITIIADDAALAAFPAATWR